MKKKQSFMGKCFSKISGLVKQCFSFVARCFKLITKQISKITKPVKKILSYPFNKIKESYIEFDMPYKSNKFYKEKLTILHKPARIYSTSVNKPFMFVLPYVFFFGLIIVLPTFLSALFSFTTYNMVEAPTFVGLDNYVTLFTNDSVFTQFAIPNTILYGVIVGPVGFMLSFLLAWMLAQVTHKWRTIYTVIIYSPSITGPIMMTVIWKVLFSGDQSGYLNHWLMSLGFIENPIQWLQEPNLLIIIMIFIGLWSSMGVGFLAILSGMLNVDKTLYEAAAIDGIRNRWQEIFYITIPQMKPQLLFGAVMSIVSTFNLSGVASALSGGTPPPQYAGWLIVDHANDFGFVKYEMGYATAVTVALLLIVVAFNKISHRLFSDN